MSFRSSGWISSRTFFSFWSGRISSRMPARRAARTFSLIPPTGRTWPLSVISPVMASTALIGVLVSADTSAVTIVTPADGPSFGIDPAGTWIWTSVSL